MIAKDESLMASPAVRRMAEGKSEAMLSPREAAQKIGVSVSLIYAWVEGKLLPHYRAGLKGRGGGKILIAEADLMAFLESLKVEAAPAVRRTPRRLRDVRL
jgi:excisionase family DNA binding protein